MIIYEIGLIFNVYGQPNITSSDHTEKNNPQMD